MGKWQEMTKEVRGSWSSRGWGRLNIGVNWGRRVSRSNFVLVTLCPAILRTQRSSPGGPHLGTAQELEMQYSPSQWSHRLDEGAVVEAHVRELTEGTRTAQATLRTLLHVPYGGGDGEKLDIYLPTDPSSVRTCLALQRPLWWHRASQWWRLAMTWLRKVRGARAGAAPPRCRGPSSPCALCPGHMDEMVAQVRRSVAFIAQQHPQLSGVYLCGHSAGAHLAAMVLSTNWEEYGVTPDIRGAFLVSGVYDLEPITHTYVNNLLHMSREVARRNSPILCVAAVEPAREACEVLIVVAQHDSLEFHRQSQEYFQALCSAGWRVSLLDVADMDHFDVIEKLSQESYILTRMVLNMITRAGI
ncbi:kynurenine formamidase isoform X4 [Carettochelys insculpta]|uniref:kynurenine formamidase isoform X4 n=1 Tax=Carettochelys insculpta TaxID=44489 RepID=UPI003EB9563F